MKQNAVNIAWDLVGGLAAPSKMPCYSWSISAKRCKMGAKLAQTKGSVCSACYALKGNYRFPAVAKAHERRFQALKSPLWVESMVTVIHAMESSSFFRWHDSGDIQDLSHLEKIVEVAKALPNVKFWLPTREYSIVISYLKKNYSFPDNLTVRLSAYMVDGEPPTSLARRLKLTTSGVTKEQGFTCVASSQGGKCLTCRACWNSKIENVNYKKH